MPFKPFRPPLIRKDLLSAISTDSKTNDNNNPPPAKRLCLEEKDKNEADTTAPSPLLNNNVATKLVSWKPLNSIRNTFSGGDLSSDNHNNNADVEAYYNVLWRKFTTKKNKTWDGDGILSIRGGYGYLRDVSGRDMGRIVINTALEPGSSLSIAGKDVEVESFIPKEDYLSGREFLGGAKKSSSSPATRPNPATSTPSITRQTSKTHESSMRKNVSKRELPGEMDDSQPGKKKLSVKHLNTAPSRSAGLGNIFKNPMKDKAISTSQSTSQPIARHDPKAPGALVMKRPNAAPKGKAIVDVVVDPLLSRHLRDHQREGVKFLYECVMGLRGFNGEGAILADEMGLGKTLQTIALLWTLLKQNPIYEASPVIKKALIVCPVTLINNWRKEFRKWLGNERIGVFVFDNKRKRLTDFTMGKAYSIMIVGYEKLRSVQEGLTKGQGIDIVIADEGHRLKTVQNKSGQAIQSLNATKRIILSGTPIQNDLREFFAAVDLVNPSVLGTYKNFMREFEGPIVRSRQPEATKKDIEKGESRSEELRELTSMFMLRRNAEILSKYLPPKTEYVLLCEPTSTQAKIYRHVLASPIFQTAMGSIEGAFSLLTILKKLCNSPSLLNPRTNDEPQNNTVAALLSSLPQNLLRQFSPSSSGKIRVLDQLLYNIRTTSTEKIVLVSNYTSTLDLLATLLTSLSLPFLRLDGSTPTAKRQSLVDDFNRASASNCFAFLLSAKAGGTGLNLIGASRLVLFDIDWNPATDMQAMARIHRDGQKRHCYIYRIMLKGGLEEKIWQRQVTKIGLADSVIESKGGMAQFSREELKDLFRLYEGDGCQTHDLLGCTCGGKGMPTLPESDEAIVISSDDEDISRSPSLSMGYPLDSDGEIDLPDLPTLLKASELDIEEQEKQIRRGTYSVRQRNRKGSGQQTRDRSDKKEDVPETSAKTKIQKFLSQYLHIDPAAFKNEELRLKDQIGDSILQSLVSDEEHGVGFIFEKTAFPTTVSDKTRDSP
ncbi:putative dsDNA-dependent ATPase [Talaromyces proteolyticus]|uniref:DsDNA-dependent ATPase n=1 Tax=Talaromyces proteolyticus TaxID=1131652 RepID=A0AAD4KTE0_9EURO|nr:putative dsDNA-dependent ATPase [Talaromyces proteolyticus]KAH8698888.1 putative dsDNA-dependent ATPase [Talaromyces proteolyticus]